MVVHMRHTRAHTGNRRSHHALSAVRLSICGNCSRYHLRHHACTNCGQYRSKAVLDVHAKIAKRAKKREAHAATKAK